MLPLATAHIAHLRAKAYTGGFKPPSLLIRSISFEISSYCEHQTSSFFTLTLIRNIQLSEVESRTQGSRPRTQKHFDAKAKDKPSRGQGQGPRTQTQVFSKKKFSKIFFRRSQK